MNRLLILLPMLISGLAIAQDAETPGETVGMGGIIAFVVVLIALVAVGIFYINKSSKMSDQERAGDKIGGDK